MLNGMSQARTAGTRAASSQLSMNESMLRCWKQQRQQLSHKCKKSTKAFRGKNAGGPNPSQIVGDLGEHAFFFAVLEESVIAHPLQ